MSHDESPATFLLDAYRRMQTIRLFETQVQTFVRSSPPQAAGSAHLCAGQEAIPVGALSALRADDRVVATYRGHGWALESGITTDELMAEICHRATGINGGRAGSAYATAPHRRFIGENSIVGAGGPIACGAAIAAQVQGTGRVTIVSFGDGAMSQGALHEALIFAAARQLPVIFVCENNGWSEMTPIRDMAKVERLSARAAAYGMEGVTADGCDPLAVRDAVAAAAAKARSGNGPTLIEFDTIRLWGHYTGDRQHYRPAADKAQSEQRDPIAALRKRLVESGACTERQLDDIDASVKNGIDAAAQRALDAPKPDPATARDHVFAPPRAVENASAPAETMELTMAKAINRALRDELESCPETLVYGEDVAIAGGVFGVTMDLQRRFGEKRVFDTPIAESAILGSAVGAAIEGNKPIVEIMFADFLLVALDSIINQAANVRYHTRGQFGAPIVVRTQQGALPGSCAQHSQSLEALLAHIPGIRVGLPATPQDAYAMLRAAARDPDPCVIFESRGLYGLSGEVTVGGAIEPAQGARLHRKGSELTIVTWGASVRDALAAAETLASKGREVAVLDLRWLSPLDDEAIAAAVASCGRVLIVHEANTTGGFGAEIAARIAERHSGGLKAPVRRLGTADTRIPASPVLQQALIPRADAIVAEALDMLSGAPSRKAARGVAA